MEKCWCAWCQAEKDVLSQWSDDCCVPYSLGVAGFPSKAWNELDDIWWRFRWMPSSNDPWERIHGCQGSQIKRRRGWFFEKQCRLLLFIGVWSKQNLLFQWFGLEWLFEGKKCRTFRLRSWKVFGSPTREVAKRKKRGAEVYQWEQRLYWSESNWRWNTIRRHME